MTYLFHEPVLSAPRSRPNALRPGAAVTLAILGSLVATLAVAHLPFVREAGSAAAPRTAVVDEAR